MTTERKPYEPLSGYDAYECVCDGTGVRYDATLADNVKRGPWITCPFCRGFGYVYVLAGFTKPRFAGERIER